MYVINYEIYAVFNTVNPHVPAAQKITDEMIFRHFQSEGVEFFSNQTSLTPLRFLMLIFWKIVRWFYSLFERMRLKIKNEVYSH